MEDGIFSNKEVQKKEHIKIQIKWPNDVLMDEKKLSGILIEKEGDFAIIGVGVNINSHPKRNETIPNPKVIHINVLLF